MITCDMGNCGADALHVIFCAGDDGLGVQFARCDEHYDDPPYREDLLLGPLPIATYK
jgi:hypothetical protein